MGVLAQGHSFRPVERDSLTQFTDALCGGLRLGGFLLGSGFRSGRLERGQSPVEQLLNELKLPGGNLSLDNALVFGGSV